MKLSIIVIFHNMQREAARTLRSLALPYQQGVEPEDYEVIAIDNGSQSPLEPADVTRWGPNFRYHFHPTTSVSPVEALNLGADLARGDHLAFIVDGARMASPGLVGNSLAALALAAKPFVASLSWHLGPEVQNLSITRGYNQQVEDALLDEINWVEDGYALFAASTLAQSSAPGFLGGMPVECSWLCLHRDCFAALGGYDKRFLTPGGGLVNHDFRDRAMQQDGVSPIVLLGEGVFHQIHGGVATNVPLNTHPMQRFQAEYQALHNQPYRPPTDRATLYHGVLHSRARPFLAET